jgi:hypothetical protein
MGLFGPPDVARLKATADVEGLVKALGYRKGLSSVPRHADDALGEIGDPRAVEPLIAALKDSGSAVGLHAASNAASALGKIGDPRAVEPLIAALKDSNDRVPCYAADALGKMSKVSVPCDAADALGKIGDPRSVGPLTAALTDANNDVRSSAADALRKIGDPRAVESPNASKTDGRPRGGSLREDYPIRAQLKIGRSVGSVWACITEVQHWSEWFGVGLTSAQWEQGGRLNLASGRFASILELTPAQELHLQFGGVIIEDIVFSLEPSDDGRATQATAQYKVAGASFSDGGASKRAEWESRLAKLKMLVESRPDSLQGEILPKSSEAQKAVSSPSPEPAPLGGPPQSPLPEQLQCVTCSKPLQDWHYDFENITMRRSLGWRCSNCGCGQAYCAEHSPNTFRKPGDLCTCGGWVANIQEGPASSSMVESASRDGKYGAHLRPPGSARPVVED